MFNIFTLDRCSVPFFFPEGIPPGVLNPFALICTSFFSGIQHSWHPRVTFCHHPRNILCLSYFLDPIFSSFLIHLPVYDGAHPLVAFWEICKDVIIWKKSYLSNFYIHYVMNILCNPIDASNFTPVTIRGNSKIWTSRLKIS